MFSLPSSFSYFDLSILLDPASMDPNLRRLNFVNRTNLHLVCITEMIYRGEGKPKSTNIAAGLLCSQPHKLISLNYSVGRILKVRRRTAEDDHLQNYWILHSTAHTAIVTKHVPHIGRSLKRKSGKKSLRKSA